MLIANPIYDVVFKYLMDDNKVAKLFISTIIGEEIEKLTIRPTEKVISSKVQPISYTVYRLDFSAKIKTPEGYKQVLIEIQKAKHAIDLMRFRRYLGEQYKTEDEVISEYGTEKRPLPIIAIYLLGFDLHEISSAAVTVA